MGRPLPLLAEVQVELRALLTAKALKLPLDVIKTRLMTQSGTQHYKGMLDCLLAIAEDEGLPALFRGLWPCVISFLLSRALLFAVILAAGGEEVPTRLLNVLHTSSVG
jgi:solute carrier family 25 2-oxodicarboxylate transporter 21